MHCPDNSNPENCAWLLNMFPWSQASARVSDYMDRAQPVLQALEAQLEATSSSSTGTSSQAAPAHNKFFGGDRPGVGDIGLFATIDMILTIAPRQRVAEPACMV